MRRRGAWALGGLLALGACANPARDDYDDFRERTAGRRVATDAGGLGGSDAQAPSSYHDVSGRWLVRVLLASGTPLGLRLDIAPVAGEDPAEAPTTVRIRIWLDRQVSDVGQFDTVTPLKDAEATIAEDGTFELVAEPLELPPEALGSDDWVRADVVLNFRTLGTDEMCGTIDGRATSPIMLDLTGSTFFARRDEEAAMMRDALPFECPAAVGPRPGGDGGVPDAGSDGGGGDAAPLPERPAAPDLSDVPSRRRDISGHYLMQTRLAGALSLPLWASLLYVEGTGEGGERFARLDGILRRATDPVDAPPLTTFTADVDAEGRFEIWLPGFSITTNVATVEADILLVGATLAEGFCGAAAGQVRRPLMLDLARSTFFATPWVPGTPQPESPPNACPADPEPGPEPDAGAPDAGVDAAD